MLQFLLQPTHCWSCGWTCRCTGSGSDTSKARRQQSRRLRLWRGGVGRVYGGPQWGVTSGWGVLSSPVPPTTFGWDYFLGTSGRGFTCFAAPPTRASGLYLQLCTIQRCELLVCFFFKKKGTFSVTVHCDGGSTSDGLSDCLVLYVTVIFCLPFYFPFG